MAANSGFVGSSNLTIGVALVLKDQFSNQARAASNAISQLETRAKQAINANLNAAQGLAMAGAAAGGAILSGMRNMIQYGAHYTKEMSLVETISGATANQMAKMGVMAKDLAMNTMFDANEVASGMKFLAMAGNDAKSTMEMIGTAAELANGLGMELGGKGGTADLLTNIMRTFKMEGKEAAVVVGDVLAKAVTSSNTNLEDMAAAIKYAGADVVMVNQSLESMAAAIGVIGDAGIQGSMAGTALANMMRNLILSVTGAKPKGQKALAALGLSREDFLDAQGNVKDLGTILTTIRKASTGLSSDKRLEYMFQLFGLRGNRAGQALLSNIERYEEVLNKISSSSGFSHSISEKMMGTLEGRINQLTSAWKNFKTQLAESIGPIIKPMLVFFTKLVTLLGKFVKTPIGKFTALVVGFGAALTVVASTVAMLRIRFMLLTNDSTVSFSNMFRVLVGGWGASKAAMEAYYLKLQALERYNRATKAHLTNAQISSLAGAAPIMVGKYATTGTTRSGATYAGFTLSSRGIRKTGGITEVRSAIDKRGRMRYYAYNKQGGVTNISKAAYESAAVYAGKPTFLGKVGRGAGKALGWAGLALTIGSLIQALTSSSKENSDAVSGNTGATDGNTSAINDNTRALGDRYKFPDPREELIMIYNTLRSISGQVGEMKLDPIIDVKVDAQGNVTTTQGDAGYDHNVK